jgi:DNA-binding response OmpR family regulator
MRIQIVDDNPEVNAVPGELFAKRDFEMTGAHSGRQAFALLSEKSFDVSPANPEELLATVRRVAETKR